MRMDFNIRFDYGHIVPWVRSEASGLRAIAGPDVLHLHTPAPMRGEDHWTGSEFLIAEGQRVPLVLTWHPSNEELGEQIDAEAALDRTERWWRAWSGKCQNSSAWHEVVERSLITLKALTYAPTGHESAPSPPKL
jgi:GH15 family glucan-1,4-alpha-glucosidase